MPPFPTCSVFSFHSALITTSIVYLLALQRHRVLILQMGIRCRVKELLKNKCRTLNRKRVLKKKPRYII